MVAFLVDGKDNDFWKRSWAHVVISSFQYSSICELESHKHQESFDYII